MLRVQPSVPVVCAVIVVVKSGGNMDVTLIIIAIIGATFVVIGHYEWRYQRLQESIDVVGTLVGELCDMLVAQKLSK